VHQASVEDVRGVYVPAYLYSGLAQTSYRAQIGEHYTVTRTERQGGQTRVVTRTETEWRELNGRHDTYVREHLVSASATLGNAELESVEPFDLRQLGRYAPSTIAGWFAEEPSRSAQECLALGQAEARVEVDRRLRRFMPGDALRGLQQETQLQQESLELTLVPLWIFALRYATDAPPMRILVNGQSAKVAGKVPLSIVKIAGTILITLLALFVAAYASGLLEPWLPTLPRLPRFR
jgi:hypothetical protein